jgi:hypothetical protein
MALGYSTQLMCRIVHYMHIKKQESCVEYINICIQKQEIMWFVVCANLGTIVGVG